jgi:plastocyanin
MRLTGVTALLALGVLACGKKADQAKSSAATTPAAESAAAPAAQPTGPVVEVKMMGSGNVYKFDPMTITVPAGGTVRFINVEGGPHNVSFYADSIPAGAAEKLNAAMSNRMDNLAGPFMINVSDHYDVSFAGLPTGTYRGFCTPHQALGMHFSLTVK